MVAFALSGAPAPAEMPMMKVAQARCLLLDVVVSAAARRKERLMTAVGAGSAGDQQ